MAIAINVCRCGTKHVAVIKIAVTSPATEYRLEIPLCCDCRERIIRGIERELFKEESKGCGNGE